MKKITLARIIPRLFSRLKLQEFTDQVFALDETVSPVTNIDDLLKTYNVTLRGTYTVAVSGTGQLYVFTVPAGKRWKLNAIMMYLSTGTWTVNQILVDDGTTNAGLEIKTYSTAVTNLAEMISADIRLEPGWKIGFYVDTFTGAGNLVAGIHYIEEDAY